tara:strand:+ start:746 stop:1246 length:501 start_codon:yes stop_codon:yes gene_type:complete
LIDQINKTLSKYCCKIKTTDQLGSVVSNSFTEFNIHENQTVGNIEKNLKIILKKNIKIIGLIHQNIPSYKKLKELKEYQEYIYNQTDLEKKLQALLDLSIKPLNYDEDWIIRSLINIYQKILSKEEKILFNKFIKSVHLNNSNLYLKIYDNLSKKFPDITKWLEKI